MNAIDRQLIANILDGIATDNTITIVNDGKELMRLHPKILDQMEQVYWWWGDEPLPVTTTTPEEK